MKKKPRSRIILNLILLPVCAVFICNYVIIKKAAPYIHDSADDMPEYKVGLLLGTSKYLKGGEPNPFFEKRIDAAILLMEKKKISYIIASGDNRTPSYNEPLRMKEELLKRGIPEEKIFLDFAGFRTLDSVVRCQKIFGQQSFVVISQKFHNERAVFIARAFGIEASAFNAQRVPIPEAPKTAIRECFAKVKAFIDVYTGESPKFLGEEVTID